ncbi:MAG: thioredoxin family protein [Verrucomicrobiaceae bacterium]|nr:thioredoxin family protein [Verrucomicrobiaceae bacterium]
MKNTLLALTTALIASILNAADFPASSPQFATSHDKVLSSAKENGKPALIVFSASWCGPCQEMKKNVYPSAEVKPFHDKFNWAYLDIDVPTNLKVFEGLKLESVPYILFLDASGKKLDVQDGGVETSKEFAAKLEAVLKKAAH